ncbi:sodium/dicarboxylate symporter family protein [Enterococcus phoeniculicola]|uniref:L-cystine uptake protein TcyP n=1 Tax=Enterococcus phoeniculicola ATCC BAA-412 TaxID=1158610 RepID=R3WF16_9ENTE|nr:L-cystine transporter [Enterococcus phoeniculicola]EOL46032.1 sodium/dicarboxylate symporter family protein [Enterococcus phoeniculicola ATCC BAA-412]EOT77123.1 sodium/dicarboxylate symporter family protein [Enterococcus phoeniculicola ATCC BAA-412]OJG73462.1 sodium/dicarboxylate symporter family protein [Enterococcus phoeniculicola]
MTTLITVLVVLIFAVLVYGFYQLQKRHAKFSTRVFSALGVGIIFGLLIQLILGAQSKTTVQAMDWISVVGNGYVAFLQMLIMPLVFVSIVGAFTKMKVSEKLGKISASVLATLLGTTAVAALIGIGTTLLFGLQGAKFTEGSAETARIAELATRQETVENLSIPQQILSFIPRNVFADFAGTRATSTIGVVIFAAFVGVAYLGIKRKTPKEAEFFANLIDSLYKLTMRIVTLVLRLTPYGVLALMTNVMATSDFAAIVNLGKFVLASYVALILVLVVHSLVLVSVKVSPITYFKKAFPVLSFAFTSRSSAGALPLNIETQTKALGVDEATANFAGSFGLSIGQNGCAGVYPAMLATIVAPTVGINVFSLEFILMLVAVVTISSFGVAGVGGGATFASLIVLGSMNLPVAIVGLVISVEPLIDMARTAVNVSDSMLAGVVTSSHIKELDRDTLNDSTKLIDVQA